MADFKTLSDKIHNLKDAENLLSVFRIMYADAKIVQGLLARYQSDADYKVAVITCSPPLSEPNLPP